MFTSSNLVCKCPCSGKFSFKTSSRYEVKAFILFSPRKISATAFISTFLPACFARLTAASGFVAANCLIMDK